MECYIYTRLYILNIYLQWVKNFESMTNKLITLLSFTYINEENIFLHLEKKLTGIKLVDDKIKKLLVLNFMNSTQ